MATEPVGSAGGDGLGPVLAHVVEGQGVAVVLLNGGLMSMSAWEPIAAALRADVRVIRCDLRGQLLSPGAPPDTLRGHAADVARLLDHLGIDEAHVVGTSFGALVGLEFGAAFPARLRSLVLIAATDRFTPEMSAATVAVREACQATVLDGRGAAVFDLLAAGTFSPDYRASHAAELATRRELIGRLPGSWFEGLDGLLASVHDVDLRPLLPAVTAPTLVLAGGRDDTFPAEHSRSLAAALPRAILRIVPSGSHALVIEHADLVADAITGFIRS